MIRNKTRRIGPAPSFICGLIAAGGLAAHFIMKVRESHHWEAQLGAIYLSVFIFLPIILFFGILSLLIGFKVETESRFK